MPAWDHQLQSNKGQFGGERKGRAAARVGIPDPLLPNVVSLVTPPSPSGSHPAVSLLPSLAGRSEPRHPPRSRSPSHPRGGAAHRSRASPAPPGGLPGTSRPRCSVQRGPLPLRRAARSLPLQPPERELSSPRQPNQPPSSRVSSPSFVCARAELGRREKGEVALSVCLPPPSPGPLEVPLGRRAPRGGRGEPAGRQGPAARVGALAAGGLGRSLDRCAPAAPRPPCARTYPRRVERSGEKRAKAAGGTETAHK